MRNRLFILFSLVFASYTSTQNLKIDISSSSINTQQDSTVITLNLKVSVPEMNSSSHINLIPVLTDGNRKTELPIILLNGKKAHSVYRRNQAMRKRQKIKESSNVYSVLVIDEEPKSINYRVAVLTESWMQRGALSIKKEIMNSKNEKEQNEIIPLKAEQIHSVAPRIESAATPAILQAEKHYKGSFISPQTDATDERNQKELNFSLDEAKVIAEVTPQMLSLSELYTVALSYKSNPAQFYKIIEISVKNYPASPVANLNAAAAAIEQGNIQIAGRYLQMASHEDVAYMNCRGVYELLSNNISEGIRLLKAAKASGSEEAAQNLKLFFEMNKQPE